ncbi:MAG: PAS domain S-box protein, partial [Planctomycetes bacterium]|nr:PAS domain S-box protein [Planctomycetota bacterium]
MVDCRNEEEWAILIECPAVLYPLPNSARRGLHGAKGSEVDDRGPVAWQTEVFKKGTAMDERTRDCAWKWSLLGLFGASAVLLAAGGYWFYRHETQAIRSEKRSELKAIAELKVGQIAAWREDRLADAGVNSTGLIRSYVVPWLEGPEEASLKADILAHLTTLRDQEDLQNMILAAPDGRILLSLDARLTVLDADAKQLVAQAVAARDAVFGDLVRCPTGDQVHLDVAAPILDLDNRPMAVLILRSDAEQFLYPFVQSWPTPSRSSETLLMRRDGDHALFLNKLRHRPDPALTLRIPLSRTDIPAVQAALGQTGAFEGRDYRGVEVLAEILPVPGSPWFLVAKVDSDEIIAEARSRRQHILLFTVLSMLVTGVTAAFVFSFQQRTFYQNLYRAEQGRRQVEEEIRATFYSIGDGVIATDAAGRVTRMNLVAEQLTGWSETEALGKPIEQVFHIVNEETRAEVDSPIQRVLRERTVVNLANHTLLLARDGIEHPIADSGAPIFDEQGQITGAVLVFRDQADERRAETLLRESHEQFQSVVNVAQDAIIMIDARGQISLWNQSAERVFGYSSEEALGQHLHRLLAPAKFQESHAKGFAEFLRSGKGAAVGKVVELSALHKDGREFPVELSLGSVRLHNQWHAVGIIRDITERKNAEQALRDSEKRFMDVLYASDDAILLIGENRFIDCNEATARMLGYATREEMLQTHPSVLSPPEQPDGRSSFEKAEEMMRLAFERGFHRFEWMHRRANGEDFPVEVSLTPIVHEGRGLLYCVWRDITEHKQIEHALHESEKGYRTLFDQSRDVMMTLAPPSWRFTAGNSAALEMFGVKSSDEFLTLGPWDVSPDRQPDGRPSADKAQEMIGTAMREGSHFFEWTHKRLSGEEFPATVLLTRLELAGQPLLQATVRDISVQKRAETQLRDEKDFAQSIFRSMADMLVVLSPDGTIATVNTATCDLLGYPECELIGQPATLLFEEEEEEEEEDTLQSILAQYPLPVKRTVLRRLVKEGSVSNVEKS